MSWLIVVITEMAFIAMSYIFLGKNKQAENGQNRRHP